MVEELTKILLGLNPIDLVEEAIRGLVPLLVFGDFPVICFYLHQDLSHAILVYRLSVLLFFFC